MQTIFKYPIEIMHYQEISMPKNARILSFQCQRDQACIWALVDSDAPRTVRRFRMVGTGESIGEKEGLSYIGTVQTERHRFVWHLFEIEG